MPDLPIAGCDELVANLRTIEERLRDLAYERLRNAVDTDDANSVAEERRVQQARRAVEKAIRALGGSPEPF